jgi:hypothetical protein
MSRPTLEHLAERRTFSDELVPSAQGVIGSRQARNGIRSGRRFNAAERRSFQCMDHHFAHAPIHGSVRRDNLRVPR